jgi:hypothetical protein
LQVRFFFEKIIFLIKFFFLQNNLFLEKAKTLEAAVALVAVPEDAAEDPQVGTANMATEAAEESPILEVAALDLVAIKKEEEKALLKAPHPLEV